MKKTELLKRLKTEVTMEEYHVLRCSSVPWMSEYNRKTMMEMMVRAECPEDEVDETRVCALRDILEDYLGIYLSDKKENWKWIILSCICLCFICKRPLHGKESVKYTVQVKDGAAVDYCSMKAREAGTACSFCVCQALLR